MIRILSALICATAFAGSASAADAKFIAPFIDEQTFAVGCIDLAGLDTDALFDRVAKFGFVPAGQVGAAKQHAGEALGKFRKLGVKNMYLVFSMADLPNPGPLAVFDGAADAKAADVKETMAGLNFPVSAVVGNALVGGSKSQVERVKSRKPSPRPDLATAFEAAPGTSIQFALVPTAEQKRIVEEQLTELPQEIGGGPGTILTKGVSWGVFGIETKPKIRLGLTVKSQDAMAARALAAVAGKALQFAAQAGKEMKLDLMPLIPVLTPKVDGDRLSMSIREDDEAVVKLMAGMAGKMRDAAGRSRSANNLKQFALALHNYHDATGNFPATGNLDKNGKPLLSWRVHILPYLEQDHLYKQFKLDEPWDSEHNKKLIAQMPEIFKSPAQQVGDGKTTYLAPMGKDTVIAPGPKGTRIQDIKDGTSNTIMIVECGDDAAVVWTKPDDLDVAADDLLKRLLGHWDNGFNAAFGDGSVRFISKTIDPKTLNALFTRSGGEAIGQIP